MENQPGSVSKLPVCWWGLFVAFRSGKKPLVSAEFWWRNAVMSHYGEKPTWECLIRSLSKPIQPLVNRQNELIFVPTFFALDHDFQRLLLSFLIHHKSELPEALTCQLVKDLEKNLLPKSQPWVISLLTILKETFNDSTTTVKENYNFSNDNQVTLTSLFSLLHNQEEHYFIPISNLEKKHIDTNKEVFVSSSHYNNSIEIINISDEEDDNLSPISKSGYGEAEEILKDVEKEKKSQNNVVELDPLELSLDIQQQVKHLKFLLHQMDEMQSITPSEMQLFVICSSKQIQQICDELELGSISESVFSTLCKNLVDMANDISYENSFHLAKVCVQPKFSTQTRQISRILTAALISFAKQFPKPFIDGVLIPCAIVKKLDLPQAELVNQLLKEVFSINHKIYFFRQLSQESPPLGNGIISLLENFQDEKLELSTEISHLVNWFRKATTTELDSSSKYGRFILMFVNKHKKQFTLDDVSNLHHIMENHKTFLKKAVLNALKGLL